METTPDNHSSPPPPIPTITLPLTLFLDVLWAYKKGQELRDRSVPGAEIVALLEAIPGHEQYYHIQHQEDCQSIVWQREFWRSSGERIVQRNEALDRLWKGIDAVLDTLQPMFPMMGRDALRQLASDLITKEQWITLESMGVDTSKLR